MIVDQYGRSPEQFLHELFEYEYCAECGGDADDHDVLHDFPQEGLFFARCRHPISVDLTTEEFETELRERMTRQDAHFPMLRFE